MDGATDSFKEPGHGVTDDRGPKVANMHLLGDVDAAHIDRDTVGLDLGFDAKSLVIHAGQRDGEGVGLESEVEKTRTGDLRFGNHAFEPQRR